MFSYCPRRPQRGVATHRLRNAQQLEPLQTNGQLSPPHREPSPPDTHRALEQVDANTSTPPPGPRLPWAVRRLANSLRVASLLSPALSFGLSYIPPPPHSEPVVDGTFSQHRLPPPKDQSAGCGLPRPLSPLSPAPPPPRSSLILSASQGEKRVKTSSYQFQSTGHCVPRPSGAPGSEEYGGREGLWRVQSLSSREPRGMVAWTQTWVGYLLC